MHHRRKESKYNDIYQKEGKSKTKISHNTNYNKYIGFLGIALAIVGWLILFIQEGIKDSDSRLLLNRFKTNLNNGTFTGSFGEIQEVYDRNCEWNFEMPDEVEEITNGVFIGHVIELESTNRIFPIFIINDPTMSNNNNNNNNSGLPFIGGSGPCHGPILEGARIRTTTNYGVDPVNNLGLPSNFIFDVMSASTFEWDCETSFNIFGSRSNSITVDGFDSISPDGKKEIMFGNAGNPNIIAVTVVWIDQSTLTIVEWDILFNEFSFFFGDSTVVNNRIDLQSIAVHEFGHALGLIDIIFSHCSQVTMYFSASLNEIHKRTIEIEDRTGLLDLYNSPTPQVCSSGSPPPPSNGGIGKSNILTINVPVILLLLCCLISIIL